MDELAATPIPDWPSLTEQTERLLAVFKSAADEARRASEQARAMGTVLVEVGRHAVLALDPLAAAAKAAAAAIRELAASVRPGTSAEPAARSDATPPLLRGISARDVAGVKGQTSPETAARDHATALGRATTKELSSPLKELAGTATKVGVALAAATYAAQRWASVSPLAADTLSKSFQLLSGQIEQPLLPGIKGLSEVFQNLRKKIQEMDPGTRSAVVGGTAALLGTAALWAGGRAVVGGIGRALGWTRAAAPAAAAAATSSAAAAPWKSLVGPVASTAPAAAAAATSSASWLGRAAGAVGSVAGAAGRVALRALPVVGQVLTAYELYQLATTGRSWTTDAFGLTGEKQPAGPTIKDESGKELPKTHPVAAARRKAIDAAQLSDPAQRAKGMAAVQAEIEAGAKGPDKALWTQLGKQMGEAARNELKLGADRTGAPGITSLQGFKDQIQNLAVTTSQLDAELLKQQIEANKIFRDLLNWSEKIADNTAKQNLGAVR